MAVVAGALLAGLAIGLARGGSLSHLARAELRAIPLLVAGALTQVVAQVAGGTAGVVLLIGSYLLVTAFAAANLARTGMGVAFVGLAMNLAVIAANGGMPVHPQALRAVGADPAAIHLDGKHHVARPSTRLGFLGDLIPIPLVGEIVSFGDLVLAVGAADVVMHLLRRPRRHAAGGDPPMPTPTAVSGSPDTG